MKELRFRKLFIIYLVSIVLFSAENFYGQKKDVFIPTSSRQIIHGRVIDEEGNPIVAQVHVWYYQLTPVVFKYDNSPVEGRTDNLISISYTTDQGFFSVRVPADTINLIITKGPEWSYVKEQFMIKEREFNGIEFNITLKRLYDLNKLGWYAGDEHSHSIYSDGYDTPSEVARAMKSVGLSWGMLTDHNSDAGTDEWLANGTPDFIPIRGCEITTEPSDISKENGYGHMNQSFITQMNGKNKNDPNIWARAILDGSDDVQAMIDSTHMQGGFISINHPFQNWDWSGRFKSWGKVKNFDAIEVWNGEPPHSPTINEWDTNKININTWAFQSWFSYLTAGNKMPGIAGSDAHDVYGENNYPKGEFYWKTIPGNARTYANLKNFSIESIKESLIDGNLFLTSNFGPLLLIKVNNKIPGEIVQVPIDGNVNISIEVLANQPLLKSDHGVRIIFNGEIIKELSTDTVYIFSKTIPFETRRDGWIITEAFGQWPMYAITNPVYLDYPPYGDNFKNKFTDPSDAQKWNKFPGHPAIKLPDGPSSWRESNDSKKNIFK